MSSDKYLSPLCSCIYCHEVKSAKGIHSHFITAHTEEGNKRIRNNAGIRHGIDSQTLKAKELRHKYLIKPNKCAVCNTNLTYDQRNNKFCSRSCAAQITNLRRVGSKYKSKKGVGSKTTIKYCICECCKVQFRWDSFHRGSKRFCSASCSKSFLFEKRSLLAISRGFGGVRQSKQINYNGVKLGSTYELKLATILDKNNIIWQKPSRFKYTTYTGKQSNYTPDFYLPEYNLYLDPKNDFLIHNINPGNKVKDIDKIAWVVEQNKISVAIIDFKNITHEFIKKLVGQAGFEPAVILSCKDSGFDHSHHCPILYL